MEEEIPFYDPKRPGAGIEPASVLDHLRRGLAFTAGDLGSHGLPLLGFADWNDTVNLPRGAESLFSANLYGLALREIAALLEFLGKPQEAQKYRGDYESMRARVEACAWDGDWYVSYFRRAGRAAGLGAQPVRKDQPERADLAGAFRFLPPPCTRAARHARGL